MEKQEKERNKNFKEFKKSKNSNKTVAQIYKEYVGFRRKKWDLSRRIKRQKTLIGFQHNIINIIIPIKQEV